MAHWKAVCMCDIIESLTLVHSNLDKLGKKVNLKEYIVLYARHFHSKF